MSLSKGTACDDFMRSYNIRAKRGRVNWGGITNAIPALGDLVALDVTATPGGPVADGVHRAAVDENVYGIIVSPNNNNGVVSVAEFTAGVTIVLEYQGTAPTLSQKVEAIWDFNNPLTTGRGTIIPGRDRVRVDNTNGSGAVVAVDASSPAGTGTCVVRYP